MIFLPMEKKENPKKNELSNAFNVFAILYCTEKKAILFLLYSLSLALRSCCSRLLTSFKSHKVKVIVYNQWYTRSRNFRPKRKVFSFRLSVWPPKLKAEYGRNSRKALDFFFPSIFQDGFLFMKILPM